MLAAHNKSSYMAVSLDMTGAEDDVSLTLNPLIRFNPVQSAFCSRGISRFALARKLRFSLLKNRGDGASYGYVSFGKRSVGSRRQGGFCENDVSCSNVFL